MYRSDRNFCWLILFIINCSRFFFFFIFFFCFNHIDCLDSIKFDQTRNRFYPETIINTTTTTTTTTSSYLMPETKQKFLSLLSNKARRSKFSHQDRFINNDDGSSQFKSIRNQWKSSPSNRDEAMINDKLSAPPTTLFNLNQAKPHEWTLSSSKSESKSNLHKPLDRLFSEQSDRENIDSETDDDSADDEIYDDRNYDNNEDDGRNANQASSTHSSVFNRIHSDHNTGSNIQNLDLTSSTKIAKLFSELKKFDHLLNRNSRDNSSNDSFKDSKISPSDHKASDLMMIKSHRDAKNNCPKNLAVTVSTNFEITSPNYPNRYPPNSHCVWHIQSQPQQTLKIQIFSLHIEHDASCRFDRLDIKGVHQIDRKTGKAFIRTKRFCGHYNKGSEFEIGSNRTTIEFFSDSYNEYPGFHLRIIAQSHDCTGEIFVINFTYMTSPNYPESYDDSKNCWTEVKTRKNHRFLVNFEDLHLESGAKCEFDFVEIFDSNKIIPSKSFGRFCSYPQSSILFLQSTSNSILFHFQSDDFLALRGYKAKILALRKDVNITYYMKCNWNADWQNMTISSPSYPDPYPENSRCETSITAPNLNERIVLLFDWIDLIDQSQNEDFDEDYDGPSLLEREERGNNNCTQDRLEIYENFNDDRPSNVFCGFRSHPFRFVSQSDSIRLVFISINSNHGSKGRNRPRNDYNLISSSQTASISPFQGLLNPGFRAKFTFVTVDENINLTSIIKEQNVAPNDLIPQQSTLQKQTNLDKVSDVERISLIHAPENASIRLGSSHLLFCEIDPKFHSASMPIIWFKGDREIYDGVTNNGTSLMIKEFQPKSAGRYICVYGDFPAIVGFKYIQTLRIVPHRIFFSANAHEIN
ncbi:Cubilin [Sarcoptes scabiei]|uniref:Cubilin n=1 Tax=Sarcoptes scabiei TaxID=52283 RepID=A0A834R5D2_SARSC|nr:Cubilin [Sarcoptes scabiei]